MSEDTNNDNGASPEERKPLLGLLRKVLLASIGVVALAQDELLSM